MCGKSYRIKRIYEWEILTYFAHQFIIEIYNIICILVRKELASFFITDVIIQDDWLTVAWLNMTIRVFPDVITTWGTNSRNHGVSVRKSCFESRASHVRLAFAEHSSGCFGVKTDTRAHTWSLHSWTSMDLIRTVASLLQIFPRGSLQIKKEINNSFFYRHFGACFHRWRCTNYIPHELFITGLYCYYVLCLYCPRLRRFASFAAGETARRSITRSVATRRKERNGGAKWNSRK